MGRAIRFTIFALLVSAASPITSAGADPPDEHYVAGVNAFKAAKYEQAADELLSSLGSQPSAVAAIYLGNAYLKLGKLAQAKDALKLALSLDPKSPKRGLILSLIKTIDDRTAPPPAAAAPSAAPAPSPPPASTPAPQVASAPASPKSPATPPAAPTPDDGGFMDCPWLSYVGAWACVLPAGFAQGRFGTPPNFAHDERAMQSRQRAWAEAKSEPGARPRGRLGVFVPRPDGSWLFVPGPAWSPGDLVYAPKPAAATPRR